MLSVSLGERCFRGTSFLSLGEHGFRGTKCAFLVIRSEIRGTKNSSLNSLHPNKLVKNQPVKMN